MTPVRLIFCRVVSANAADASRNKTQTAAHPKNTQCDLLKSDIEFISVIQWRLIYREAPPVMSTHQTRQSFHLRESDHPTRVRALPAVSRRILMLGRDQRPLPMYFPKPEKQQCPRRHFRQ